MAKPSRPNSFWKDNLRIVSILLLIWFLVGYVGGIFGIEWLNRYSIGQVGLGFWIAQQGAICAFVLIVMVYAVWMDRIDKKHGVDVSGNESVGDQN